MVRRNALLALAHQLLHKLRDVAAGERNVLDRRADDEAFSNWNDVRGAVARVVTVPVSVRSVTSRDDHEAASARTAWTAMYKPGTLNVSNMISAVYSRFSGALSGGSVRRKKWSLGSARRHWKMHTRPGRD